MKKIFLFAALICGFALTSCEKDEIGGTATESMAGQWYVTIDAVDDSGNPINQGEDYFGVGKVLILTYNTASNSANQMWIDTLDKQLDGLDDKETERLCRIFKQCAIYENELWDALWDVI